MKNRWSLYLMATLYLVAGVNHFVNPSFYLRLIPPYLGDAELINIGAGLAEILLAVLLLFNRTRKLAAYGIVGMLIAFLPTHIFMLQKPANGAVEVPGWILWLRLLVIQPLLILWAWSLRHMILPIKKAS